MENEQLTLIATETFTDFDANEVPISEQEQYAQAGYRQQWYKKTMNVYSSAITASAMNFPSTAEILPTLRKQSVKNATPIHTDAVKVVGKSFNKTIFITENRGVQITASNAIQAKIATTTRKKTPIMTAG